MSGVAVLRRRERVRTARPFNHITKAVMAKDFRGQAHSLHAFAATPDAAASALKALDWADKLEQHPRCGWYPHRPKGWRP